MGARKADTNGTEVRTPDHRAADRVGKAHRQAETMRRSQGALFTVRHPARRRSRLVLPLGEATSSCSFLKLSVPLDITTWIASPVNDTSSSLATYPRFSFGEASRVGEGAWARLPGPDMTRHAIGAFGTVSASTSMDFPIPAIFLPRLAMVHPSKTFRQGIGAADIGDFQEQARKHREADYRG
ncbi:hypothetical protein V6C03_09525 [Methyloligella sp. 2.7D]|uniref:hypothetical protein n=1 Tax=unclassified Methyloligella TaxID=2625955 RepID=UPI00157D7975|nr:hypothetical protein [Methyloligella sp. GL2]QKP77911.1 hypothetical protein HT051_10930 [Methyloligella sp. GL2]